jgi:LDH2 family malate/lactate/ureidoglycolate dehydrogenase
VQLLGILAGSATVIDDVSNYGLFFVVVDPAILMEGEAFRSRVSELRRAVQSNRPMAPNDKVRVPGDGSLARRRQRTAAGVVHVDDRVYERLVALCG